MCCMPSLLVTELCAVACLQLSKSDLPTILRLRLCVCMRTARASTFALSKALSVTILAC
jgi:hypothetical protein